MHLKSGKELGLFDVKEKQDVISDLKTIKKDLDNFIQEQIQYYQNVDMSAAEEAEFSSYESEMNQVRKLVQAKEQDYPAIQEMFGKIR